MILFLRDCICSSFSSEEEEDNTDDEGRRNDGGPDGNGDNGDRAGGRPGTRVMNVPPQTLDECNDKFVARKNLQLFNVFRQLEIMSTAHTDGTAPAFNGMTNIPENHAVILNISYCEPNTQGGDRRNVTPDDKRRRVPVVTLAAMRGNKMVTDGTLRAALQAVANHCGPQVRGGPNPTLDQLEQMSTQRVDRGEFHVALVYDQAKYHTHLYGEVPSNVRQAPPDGGGALPDGGGPPGLGGLPWC